MKIATTMKEVREAVAAWKKDGLTVGLVPTMGALHEGHASLVDAAKDRCDRVVASVFVNPTQFAAGEDLDAYPRDFERDCQVLEAHGCDLVFHPEVEEMYPEGAATFVELRSDMTKQLCGKSRPEHFCGVCTVVSKLFHIVTPDKAFFGEKDAQQLAVIRQMARDLLFGIEIVGCPTKREEDGLAKSSRNAYLNAEERQAAGILYQSICKAQEYLAEHLAADGGKTASRPVVELMKEVIQTEPLAQIDYVDAVDGMSLMPAEEIGAGDLVALAVNIGKTRLIDNFTVRG